MAYYISVVSLSPVSLIGRLFHWS